MVTTTKFIWDEDNYLAETNGADGVQVVYTTEPQQYGKLVSQNRNAVMSYFHFDVLGSTRQLSMSEGVVSDALIYDAWGMVVSRMGGTNVSFQWLGENNIVCSSESQTYAIGRNTFSSSIGRYASNAFQREADEDTNEYLFSAIFSESSLDEAVAFQRRWPVVLPPPIFKPPPRVVRPVTPPRAVRPVTPPRAVKPVTPPGIARPGTPPILGPVPTTPPNPGGQTRPVPLPESMSPPPLIVPLPPPRTCIPPKSGCDDPVFRGYVKCANLPANYKYETAKKACKGVHGSAKPANRAIADRGPCAGEIGGFHWRCSVGGDMDSYHSVGCCTCCIELGAGASLTDRCSILPKEGF